MNFGDFFSFLRSQWLTVASSTSRPCPSLPDDILIEIFAHLPLNSIYKFRCLSKVWLSNLSNPNFITKWFQINSKSLSWIHYHSVAVDEDVNKDADTNPSKFRNAYPESHSEFMSRNEHLFSFGFLRDEKPFQGARLYLLGSSNGLVLCWSVDHYQKSRYHVCNPLTKTWVTLPSPPHSSANPFHVNDIFCEYSSSLASRYKVVRIPPFHVPSKKISVDVFCSDMGIWESFQVSCDEDVVWDWSEFDKVVILNGVLFWIEGGNRMLVYNLNQKIGIDGHGCSLINLPHAELDNEEYDSNCILGESEGRVYYAEIKSTERRAIVSVWVLDEVNWQILHKNISADDIKAEVCSVAGDQGATIQVLGFSPLDHNIVLIGWTRWVWGFNIQTRSVEKLCLGNSYVYDAGVTYLPFVLMPMPTVLPPPSWITSKK